MKIVYTILCMINHTKEKCLRKKRFIIYFNKILCSFNENKKIFLQIYNVLKENILHIFMINNGNITIYL